MKNSRKTIKKSLNLLFLLMTCFSVRASELQVAEHEVLPKDKMDDTTQAATLPRTSSKSDVVELEQSAPKRNAELPFSVRIMLDLIMNEGRKRAAAEGVNYDDFSPRTRNERFHKAYMAEAAAIIENYTCVGKHDPDAQCAECSCVPKLKHVKECKPCEHGFRGCEEGCAKGCNLLTYQCKVLGKHRHDCGVCVHEKRDCSHKECETCLYCPLCLKLIGKDYETTSCGHSFCGVDIRHWEQDYKGSCPICRKNPITYLNKECAGCEVPIGVNDQSVTVECVVRYWSSLRDGWTEHHPLDKFYQPTNFSHRFHAQCYAALVQKTGENTPCFCPVHKVDYDDDPLWNHYVGYLQLLGRNNKRIEDEWLTTYMQEQNRGERRPVIPDAVLDAYSSFVSWFGNKFLKPQ